MFKWLWKKITGGVDAVNKMVLMLPLFAHRRIFIDMETGAESAGPWSYGPPGAVWTEGVGYVVEVRHTNGTIWQLGRVE